MLKETRKQPGPTGISNEDINDWINSSNGGGGSGSSGMSIRIGQGEHQSPTEPIDPFSPAPDTKSIYIDIPVSISPSPIPTIPRSPFIRSQSQPLPRSSSSFYSFPPPPPRRNSVRRPVSIHTTPIPMSPSPSTLPRRFSVRIEGDNYDKTWSWSVREEIVSLCPTPAAVEEERDEWMFDLGEVDWRQFHVELLDVNEEALINTTAGSLSPYLETDTYYYT
uniref:Uncharacterized protein n=1 Tax=Moniliophthora roreri TaxID=221103 RepID=A0A0W0FNY7_MONRR